MHQRSQRSGHYTRHYFLSGLSNLRWSRGVAMWPRGGRGTAGAGRGGQAQLEPGPPHAGAGG